MRIIIVDWINLFNDCPALMMPSRLSNLVIEGHGWLEMALKYLIHRCNLKQLEGMCYVISLKGDKLRI